jgi:hypothetical protein
VAGGGNGVGYRAARQWQRHRVGQNAHQAHNRRPLGISVGTPHPAFGDKTPTALGVRGACTVHRPHRRLARSGAARITRNAQRAAARRGMTWRLRRRMASWRLRRAAARVRQRRAFCARGHGSRTPCSDGSCAAATVLQRRRSRLSARVAISAAHAYAARVLRTAARLVGAAWRAASRQRQNRRRSVTFSTASLHENGAAA